MERHDCITVNYLWNKVVKSHQYAIVISLSWGGKLIYSVHIRNICSGIVIGQCGKSLYKVVKSLYEVVTTLYEVVTTLYEVVKSICVVIKSFYNVVISLYEILMLSCYVVKSFFFLLKPLYTKPHGAYFRREFFPALLRNFCEITLNFSKVMQNIHE